VQPEPGWLHRHSLGLFAVAVFLAFTAGSITFGWDEYQSEQEAHGLPADSAGFWAWWRYEYSMSLVADFAGFVLLVLATKKLREIGSAESN
jgi:uncharacterized BrkB/YihY/UPF0761 family membrane protein